MKRDIAEELERLNRPALLPSLQRALTAAVAEIRRLRSAAPSDRDVVIEECAQVAESWQQYVDPTNRIDEAIDYTASQIAEEIRQLKTASSSGGDQP